MQDKSNGANGAQMATFGCVLAVDDELTRANVAILCEALSRHLSLRIEPFPQPSPGALAKTFAAGLLELAWVSPTLALLSPTMRKAVPVVRTIREGLPHYHSVLFVREDSPIETPAQLHGARAAWIDPSSASGYIFPRIALVGHGLDPDNLFARETFYESHGAAARAVARGEADVGATFAHFGSGDATRPLLRAGFSDAAPEGTMRVLLVTPPIPSDLVLAAPGLWCLRGQDLVEAFEEVSLESRTQRAIQQVLGADGFVRCDERALDELRRQIADAEALELIHSG